MIHLGRSSFHFPTHCYSRGKTALDRVFMIGFFAAITVATFGWVTALGWFAVKLAEWLLA